MNISTHPSLLRIALLVFLALGAVTVRLAEAAQPVSEITIEGSHLTRELLRPRTGSVIPTEVVTLTRHVTYADLDLGTQSGAMALTERVDATSKAVCKELDRAFPFSVTLSGTADCVRKAKNSALAQVREAVAHAEQERVATR